MTGNLLGIAISLKTRLVDKAVGKLSEPLRAEVSGLRAEAAGRMKELAGFGIKVLSSLNESIDVNHEILDNNKGKADGSKLNKIELD